MSRSYRKPYSSCTGKRSAADDKKIARRSWRHAQNNSLRSPNIDWDEFLIPARYEASYNDVWGWGRDGKQSLYDKPKLDWDVYAYTRFSYWTDEELLARVFEDFERDIEYYEYLKRK